MNASRNIREHMEVVGSDGGHVGTVDYLDGPARIKLTRDDSLDGMHHFIPTDFGSTMSTSMYT